MSRVVVAMSGGVDSSVAACLLQRQGYEVIGVFMRHGEHPPDVACRADPGTAASPPPGAPKQGCCSAADAEDARRVADQLEIPFYVLNLEADFGRIIAYFVAEYTAGRTPNPCVRCNQWLKFGKLFDYADSIGAEFVATGHYARLVPVPGPDGPELRCGVDPSKDQSYALFSIERRLLPRILLPIGDYAKPKIRELAAQFGLRVADKPDSQEICFVPAGQHAEFIRRRRGPGLDTSGDIVTTTGQVVGRHPGIEGFTVGQRKGLGVALGEPCFVVRIESETRRVVIGAREDLARTELTASQTNWLVAPPPTAVRCLAKIRYNSRPAPAEVTALPGDRLQVVFDEPRSGIAPGQAVVCYAADRVLGGGWIE